MRKVIRKVRGEKERLVVLVDKKRLMVIYHDNSGWWIGNSVVGKLSSYSYFRYLIKREFGHRIRNSQVRWLYNYLKRRHIREERLGSDTTPDLLKRRERRMGKEWGRWENKQLFRIGEMDEKRREVMMGLVNDIYREEVEGEKVFVLWSPMGTLEGGGNPPLISEPSTSERGMREREEVGYGNHFG